MNLAELRPILRREHVAIALDMALRQLESASPTGTVVDIMLGLLGSEERQLVARDVVELAPAHSCAAQVGEEFKRFGRTMRRWEWKPLRRDSATEIERRRAAQAAAEADDEWTIYPEDHDDES